MILKIWVLTELLSNYQAWEAYFLNWNHDSVVYLSRYKWMIEYFQMKVLLEVIHHQVQVTIRAMPNCIFILNHYPGIMGSLCMYSSEGNHMYFVLLCLGKRVFRISSRPGPLSWDEVGWVVSLRQACTTYMVPWTDIVLESIRVRSCLSTLDKSIIIDT